MIWNYIFSDPMFEVWQIGNWQITRHRDDGTSWLWAPVSQSTLRICRNHPKPIDFDGNTCPVCLIERERTSARKDMRP